METGEIIWAVCSIVTLLICVAIAVRRKRWKWFFLISWSLLAVLGPVGLCMVIGEWYGNRPYPTVTTADF